ncbi:hemolytic protein HlpA [Bacteroidia bacterium]|nr:hemolytic protein HlpA [Bacteroidia bacterium]GHV70726.1 hemolytic protein HlpA [Bacteroidia bacterium]
MNRKIPPVLLIVFNRLHTTRRVFQAIREAQPARLFIAADGPRPDNADDAEKSEAVRQYVLENIDWECEVKTLFRAENLGCGPGPATAISWFFEHVEEGVILEDDCLPHPEFWEYCGELLDKYRDNKQIAVISGNNFQEGKKYGKASYYFTKYVTAWGWATWRRTWQDCQFDLNLVDKDFVWRKIDSTFKNSAERTYWKSVFNKAAVSSKDIWDYQFCFHVWSKDMFCIAPNVNLVQNIGFGDDATHTFDPNSKAAFVKTGPLLPLIHTRKIEISNKADEFIFAHYYSPYPPVNLFKRVIRKFKRIVRKFFLKS